MFDSQASMYRAATASAMTSGAAGTSGATGTSGAALTSGAAAISSPFKGLMSNTARQAVLGLTMVFTFALLVGV